MPLLELETKAPSHVHLDQLQAKASWRLHVRGHLKFMAKACKAIEVIPGAGSYNNQTHRLTSYSASASS